MGLDTLARVLRRNGGHNAVQLDQNGLKMEMGPSALLKVEDLCILLIRTARTRS